MLGSHLIQSPAVCCAASEQWPSGPVRQGGRPHACMCVERGVRDRGVAPTRARATVAHSSTCVIETISAA